MTTFIDVDRADIVEGLANMCHAAKREMPVVGVPGPETAWDRRHDRLNDLLTQLEQWDAAHHAEA